MKSRDPSALSIIGPLNEYRRLVALGIINYDELQMRAVLKLQSLHDSLIDYDPPAWLLDSLPNPPDSTDAAPPTGLPEPGGLWSTVAPDSHGSSSLTWNPLHQRDQDDLDDSDTFEVPKGFWLCGEVGTGKTMLLDIFFSSIPTPRKRKVHFHAFMLETYRKMHQWHTTHGHIPSSSSSPSPSPHPGADDHVLQWVARELVKESWLVAFDEFQPCSPAAPSTIRPSPPTPDRPPRHPSTTHPSRPRPSMSPTPPVPDIATAAILKQLFSHVFRMGGVVVATSNRSPENLYRGGYQRHLFSSFMDLLRDRMEIHDMRSTVDYRSEGAAIGENPHPTYYRSDEPDGVAKFEDAVAAIVGGEELLPHPLPVSSRHILIPRMTPSGTALFTFTELCRTSFGPADMLALCTACHTVVVRDVPRMGMGMKDPARRWITFVDAAYEMKVKLIVLAAATPEDLFVISPSQIFLPTVSPPSPDHEGSGSPLSATDGDAEMDTNDIMLRETLGAALSQSSRQRAYRSMWGARSGSEEEEEKKAREDVERLAIFTAEDEIFAFRRASSRIREMGWGGRYAEESGAGRKVEGWTGGVGWGDPENGPNVEVDAGSVTATPHRNDSPASDDWGDEASYRGYLKQFTRFNQQPDETHEDFIDRIRGKVGRGRREVKGKPKPMADWHFFGLQGGDEDSWGVKLFMRQLRKKYEGKEGGAVGAAQGKKDNT
ncbi:hypothetical protein HDU93_002328 [Gonapodya sp. JEL0774]|nr:hypothetical protein HDU93_002328 [Gonapodya sp. JEL0774]